MKRLVVLGGSSPFTAALIEALAASEPDEVLSHFLVLHGRDAERLALMTRYAAHRLEPLGWRVAAEASLPAALEGSDRVLHQIRYGGLTGRAEDESIAHRHGAVADETLGPGALHALLRTRSALRVTGQEISRRCPDALVINLTNPLSLATAILCRSGVRRGVGVCELPRVTASLAAALLEIPAHRLTWRYRGLNHRGFVVELRQNGRERIAELADAAEPAGLAGVPASVLRELNAAPTKYHRWLVEDPPPRESRACVLVELGRRIFEELRLRPTSRPESLGRRYTAWYPLSVVPLLAALDADEGRDHVLNVLDPDGLVRERHVSVRRGELRAEPPPPCNAEVRRWLDRFEEHERAMLALASEPTRARLVAAVEADPMFRGATAPLVEQLAGLHGLG